MGLFNITKFLSRYHAHVICILNSMPATSVMEWIGLAGYYLNYTTAKYTDVTGTASKQITFSQVKLRRIATDYAARRCRYNSEALTTLLATDAEGET